MAGRPRKTPLLDDEKDVDIMQIVEEKPVVQKDLHQIFRVISKTGLPENGSQPIQEVDAYVTSWLNNGYRLQQSFMLAVLPEGYQMLYVLVRE